MRINVQILSDNRIVPTVMNINQGQNKIDTALYSMENYVINDVDLSTCDWYAVLMGVYGLDEVKLTREIDEGVLKVRWDLNNYVTNIGQTLTYQIVAKKSDGTVYYTNKGIILNSQSIHADEFIVANYPSILRQWEEYMKDLSGTSLDAYVVMNLGEYIPVEERVEGKFYINRLTDYDYSCLIEDAKGNVITPSAKGVSYDPTKTKLSAYNVQDALDVVAKRSSGTVKFCVNEGNLTDGMEDLISYSDNTLSFKVGGEYSNLIATKADNTMFERGSLNDVDLQEYDDGVYKVCVDEDSTELTNGEIYAQLEQPENMQDGDIWFNGIVAQKYTQNENPLTFKNTGRSYQLNDIATNGSVYVACTANGKILVSTNNLQNWTEYSIHTGTDQLTAVTYVHSLFYTVSYEGTLYSSPDGINWTQQTQKLDAGVNKLKAVNNYLVAVSAIGKVSVMNQNKVWSYSVISGDAINLSDIVFDGTYYYLSGNRKIYRSTNLTTWVEFKSVEEANISCLYLSDNKLLCGGSPTHLYTHDFNTSAWASYDFNTAGTITGISKIGNEFFIVGTNNNTYRTTNLQNFEQLTTDTENIVIFQSIKQDIAVGSNGVIAQITSQTSLQPFTKVPVGEVVKEGGVITEVATYPYNVNGLTMASPTTFGLMRVAAPEDEVDCSCNDASITPSNLYDLSNYRRANTEYNVDDKVGCPYHHNLQLKCAVAGTTSSETLNTKGVLEPKTEIVDGTVTWVVEELGTGGGSGLNVGDIFHTSRLDTELNGAVEANGGIYAVADFTGEQSVPALLAEGKLPFVSMTEYESIVSSNGSCRAWGWDNGDTFRVPTAEKMKRILVAKKEATTENPTWYNLYSDGWLEQGGVYIIATTGKGTIAFLKQFVDSDYCFIISKNSLDASTWTVMQKAGTKTEYSVEIQANLTGYELNGSWYACGYAEIPTEAEYQFQNIEVQRAMVQIATGATDEALATCTSVLQQLANKADKDVSVKEIPSTSGTVTLADNTIYSGTMTDAITFVLPTVTDATKYHQIKAMLYLPVVTIDWGTTHYIGGEAPDISEAGQYMIYFDYVPALSAWAVGCMKVV